MVSNEPLEITYVGPGSLRPYARNARRHSKAQIKQLAASIEQFGFVSSVLISDDGEIICGHGRVEAAKLLGLKAIPTVKLSHLSEAQRRAYVLADNQLALNAGWDKDLLAIEFSALVDLGFDLTVTGFSVTEIDLTLEAAREADPAEEVRPEDELPEPVAQAVTRLGDVWVLGRHRLICGDAREPAVYETLLQGSPADLVITDPPYNVQIDGNVTGLGKIRHREFAMASGEMSSAEFVEFLKASLGRLAHFSRDGAIAFVCMDWRHMGELVEAGNAVFSELKNVCVWNKTNAGMGTFYRSKHELVFVFKVGTAAHINTFGLGDTGRYRTNVWDYAGVTSPGSARREALAMHPTVKPVAMIADAIKDCTRRRDIVLDAFGGSGTTLIAAEMSGRLARLIELDPLYCDTIVRRFERFTGKSANLEGTDLTFEDVETQRLLEVMCEGSEEDDEGGLRPSPEGAPVPEGSIGQPARAAQEARRAAEPGLRNLDLFE